MNRQAWRIARIVIVLALVAAGTALQTWREKDAPAPPPAERPAAEKELPESRPEPTPAPAERPVAEKKKPETRPAPTPAPAPAPATADTTVEDVTIRDLSNRVVFEGDVDLRETLERIDAGRKLKFRNDGTVFQNRERRLPARPSGYYREWVHPTPGLSGPGPQRVITGDGGEAFYTPDHYKTFEKIR